MSEATTITVLVPARNERADIERCLRAVLAQDHPHDRMEIILVDGGSTDGTAELAERVLAGGGIDWKVIHNLVGTTPSNLNAGLAVATGDVVCRVDARSIVPPEYARICAEVLSSRLEVSVTGGAQVAIALDHSAKCIGIARALNNRYAMGGSRYRSCASSGPSDTVYLGAFRAAELRRIGGWDEYFITNQDYELNRRLATRGVIWFDDRLRVGYVPRRKLVDLWRQYYRFGRWKVRYWRRTGDRPRPRQSAAVFGALLIVGALSVGMLRVRSPAGRVSVLSAPAVFLVSLDAAGSQDACESFAARVMSALALAAVTAGWLTGALREFVSPQGDAR